MAGLRAWAALRLAALLVLLGATAGARAGDVAIVMDASGSMWGEVDGRDKIAIARDVLGDLVTEWPAEHRLGLVAYGHRRKGDCGDIETVIDVGPVDAGRIRQTVEGISPKGKTPLTTAVEHAADLLRYTEERASVVLLSDGIETCNRDPCAAASQLERTGVDFTAHVIGFDVARERDRAQLRCLAENTGGRFLTAASADELRSALTSVTDAAVEPEPEPPSPDVELTVPEQVTVGTRFDIDWAPSVSDDDFVTIVAADAGEREFGDYWRVGDGQPGELRAPRDPGAHEVRYVRNRGKKVLGRAAIEVVDAAVSLEVPEQVTVGTSIEVRFDRTIAPADYLTVVPADAPEGTVGAHVRASGGSPLTLPAPGDTGKWEVRYVLEEGRRTMGRAPVETTGASVAVQAPDTAPAGSTVSIRWDKTVSGNDFITIVPADAGDDVIATHERAAAGSPVALRTPGEPGLYEARYVLDKGRKLLGRSRIELTESEVSIDATETAPAGSSVEIAWQGTVSKHDFITLVPADAEDGAVATHERASAGSPLTLRAPGDPGPYEARYVLERGRRTLARAPVELTEPSVSIEATGSALAGSSVEITWQGTVSEHDFITIVPADAEDSAVATHKRASAGSPLALAVPGEPGRYEARYVLERGRRTLARAPVELTEPSVSIEAPATVGPGGRVEVAWQGTVSEHDFITIVPADAEDGAVGRHERASAGSPLTLRAPEQPGVYEVRYVLERGRRTLAGARVRVSE